MLEVGVQIEQFSFVNELFWIGGYRSERRGLHNMSAGITLDLPASGADTLEIALGAGEALAKQIQIAEELRQKIIEMPRALVPVAAAYPTQVQEVWQHWCKVGMAGHAEDVQAQREKLLWFVNSRLDQLQRIASLVESISQFARRPLPEPDQLRAIGEELRRLKAAIFDKWVTLENLEDLLAAQFPLSTAKLEALGQQHRPDPAWYAQDTKPF